MDIPEIRYLKPTNTREIGLYKGKEMYGLIRDPEKLRYLNDPYDFDWIWDLMYQDD
jgi:glucose-6-phosphate isomerase